MSLTDEQIVTIRDDHLPNQGERLDCIAFARAVIRADHCVSDEAGLDAAYADGRKDEREDIEQAAERIGFRLIQSADGDLSFEPLNTQQPT
jgi:hypothetical protein